MRTQYSILALGLVGLLAQGTARACHDDCKPFYVPVNVIGYGPGQIYGELCVPAGAQPATVQLLVHTTGANHNYWDPPNPTYSYRLAANGAGYATFNVDRLGTGKSTTPPSYLVTIASVEDALHQVIAALRAGSVGGRAFSKVVWVGSSYGSAYGWVNAATHPGDIDAYVLTSIMHYTKPSFMANLALPAIVSVCDDPVFHNLGLDCNYISTKVGSIGPVYFEADTGAPGFVDGVYDAVIRDVVSLPLLGQSLAALGGITSLNPPTFTPMPTATDPAQAIHVPALVVVGDHDNIFCGAPDGLDCSTAAKIQAFEAPYYGVAPDVYLAKDSGHVFALQLSAPDSFAAMVSWVNAHIGAN